MDDRTLTWLRGALLGGAVICITALTGCAMEPVEESESVLMAGDALELLEPNALGTEEEPADEEVPGGKQQDPDPLPWQGRPGGPEGDPWNRVVDGVSKSSSLDR